MTLEGGQSGRPRSRAPSAALFDPQLPVTGRLLGGGWRGYHVGVPLSQRPQRAVGRKGGKGDERNVHVSRLSLLLSVAASATVIPASGAAARGAVPGGTYVG